MPISQLHSRLLGILSDATPPPSHPVGYLTAVDRDNWAGLREELISDQTNRASLQAIDSAMFVLCLDDSEPETPEELSHIMLHNHGHNRSHYKAFRTVSIAETCTILLPLRCSFQWYLWLPKSVRSDFIRKPWTTVRRFEQILYAPISPDWKVLWS